MYRGYVDQLDSQSPAGEQQVQSSQVTSGNMCDQDEDKQWRKQWTAKPIDELWQSLSKGKSMSLLKKHLTEERFNLLKDKKTELGGTLAQCISSGKTV